MRRSTICGLRRWCRDQQGHAAAEYAILLGLLVLVAMATIGSIGSRVYNIYQAIEEAVAFFA